MSVLVYLIFAVAAGIVTGYVLLVHKFLRNEHP
jgi:hypothetical protein